MQGLAWARGPLGEEIERYQHIEMNKSGWKRAMKNWTAMQHEISQQDSRFWANLSGSQQNSYRILLERWNGEYEDLTIIAEIKNTILRHCDSADSEERIPASLKFGQSDYQKQLFENFLYEFFFYGRGKAAPIQLRRQAACRSAACQRLSYLASLSLSEELRHKRTYEGSSPVGGVIEACPWLPRSKRRDCHTTSGTLKLERL